MNKKSDNRRVIKHPPVKTLREVTTPGTIYISKRTPFVSALKRVTKQLDVLTKKQANRKYVRVIALGRSMDLALSIGTEFQSQGRRVDVVTGTELATDEIDDSGGMEEPKMQRRSVSKVEVRIYK
jgi:ribonuclease P/MRP protein subunit POP7